MDLMNTLFKGLCEEAKSFHIDLNCAVVLDNFYDRIALALGIPVAEVKAVAYGEKRIIIEPGEYIYRIMGETISDDEFRELDGGYDFIAETNAQGLRECLEALDVEAAISTVKNDIAAATALDGYATLPAFVRDCPILYATLASVDGEELRKELDERIRYLNRRLALLESFYAREVSPACMIAESVDLPLSIPCPADGVFKGKDVDSEFEWLIGHIIRRNDSLAEFISKDNSDGVVVPSMMMANAKGLVQKAVDEAVEFVCNYTIGI